MLRVEPGPTALETARSQGWEVNPFLHRDPGRLYNPLSDEALTEEDPLFAVMGRILGGGLRVEELAQQVREALLAGRWIAAPGTDVSRQYYLKYAVLETHTVCNQACYFCPVATDPREAYFMPSEQFEGILDQLQEYASTLEAVFLMSYNEPTVDRRFLAQCRSFFRRGLPLAVLSNGSGLSPEKTDALVAEGPIRYLSVNLSTVDREKYLRDRGQDHLQVVLDNLHYAKDRPVAQEMDLVVLGTGDDQHRRDLEEIRRLFGGSRFNIKSYEVMDRAGLLQIGLKPVADHRRLCGCDNVGSRPLQYIHINPQGKCLLCCEDYEGYYEVGDLNSMTIREVLTGPEMARMRRWVYGIEEAPDSFMCRKCIFARTADPGPESPA